MLPTHALTFTADTPPADLDKRLAALALPPGVTSTDLFTPHPDHAAVPFFTDGPPPAALVEFAGDDPEALAHAAPVLAAALEPGAWRAGLFRIAREPVGGKVVAREAPMSFLVRYFGPTADPAHFAAHYVANHPPILARFPKIRNVLCYIPLGAPPGLEPDPCLIRNEVVFDDVPDLVAALHSPVLPALRADSKTFAPFGRSTHHAMRRTKVR